MMFWILISVMSVAAMAAVALPLLRVNRQEDNSISAERKYYDTRIAEIESDVKHGRLDVAEAELVKAEIARKLIAARQDQEPRKQSRSALTKPLLIVGSLVVPILAVAIYSAIGTPPGQIRAALQTEQGEPLSIQTLLAAAENRLQSNPDDAQGWIVIAPVYMRLEQFGKAVNAYRNGIRLEGRDPRLVVGLGEALMAEANGRVTDEAHALFTESIKTAPGNGIASFYLGVHALQQGDEQAALSIWQAAVDGANGQERWLPVVRQRIQELQAQISATEDKPASDEQDAMIAGMVERLEERLNEDPNDKEGWEMLVRSYIVLGKLSDAEQALKKALDQFGSDEAFAKRMEPYQQTINQTVKVDNE